ncbi:hypothetical protein [Candidatus Albibeggiatoa sp. nov. BB20]|uniref:hypothetical protein n=1 Tax=Candidatus Albibeggiatoa sp. nov. BB20 TaxID=3162723 RepID=UPI003365788A
MSNCKICLRPHFMDYVAVKLLARESVNIIIQNMEREAARFVTDIQKYEWDKQLLVVNMAGCRKDYGLFLQQLSAAYQQVSHDNIDLGALARTLSEDKREFVIVLYRLDVMQREDVDSRFNQDFYNTLNSFKNIENINLLTIAPVSLESGRGLTVYIDGKLGVTSPLVIAQNFDLPELRHEELRYELNQRDLGLTDQQAAQVLAYSQVNRVYHYDYFDNICNCLAAKVLNYPERDADFVSLLRKVREGHKPSWERWVINQKNTIKRWYQLLGIGFVVGLFVKVWQFFFDPMAELLSAIADWIKSRKK